MTIKVKQESSELKVRVAKQFLIHGVDIETIKSFRKLSKDLNLVQADLLDKLVKLGNQSII